MIAYCAASHSKPAQFEGYTIFAAMPQLLKGAIFEQIRNDLRKALPDLKIKEYFKVKQDLLSDSDHVILGENEDGEVIGALASKWYNTSQFSFLHIMTMFVASKHQGTPLFKRMWNAHLSEVLLGGRGFPCVFSLKTYNPISCSLIRQVALRSGAQFYPQLDCDLPKWMEDQVIEISRALEPEATLDLRTGVIRGGGGMVPADFYPAIPKSARRDIMLHFTSRLAAEDRLLCCLFCREPSSQQNILQQFAVIQASGSSSPVVAC